MRERFELFDYLGLPSWCCRNSATEMAPSWCCQNSAAKLAASWARFTKLAASMVHIYQTYAKYGNPSHTWRISGSTRQYDHARKVFSRSLKLRINGCLQICRQAFCFSCAFHMRQRFGTKLDVYGCFDSPLNAQIREKPPLNIVFTGKTTTKQSISGRFQKFSFGGEIGHGVVK